MNKVIFNVRNTILNNNMINPGDKVLVGFSGGADSLFLMLSLMELMNDLKFTLYAAHLNHGIRGVDADNDETFVKEFCYNNNIEIYTKKVDIPQIAKKLKISEECAGRNERYSFFNKICKEHNINKIAVAHNKNDSVETVIFNMIRGSSLKGLCGIRYVNGNIIRPILDISRAEIEDTLKEFKMNFCVDSTNKLDIYTRNKIRNNIIKSMSDINPSVIDTIYCNTASLINDDDFMESYCHNLNCITVTNNEIIINKSIFDKQHIAIKSRLIVIAFQKLCGSSNNLTSKHIEILCKADKSSKSYNMPGGVYAKVSYSSIMLTKEQTSKNEYSVQFIPETNIILPFGDKISLSSVSEIDKSDSNSLFIDADLIKSDNLIVRNRINGDKFTPYGMRGQKKVKQYFNELKIPSYDRDKVPIIVDGNEIVAIVPYRISDKYKITENTKRILKINITKEDKQNV